MGEDEAGPGALPTRAPVRRGERERSARALIDAVFPADAASRAGSGSTAPGGAAGPIDPTQPARTKPTRSGQWARLDASEGADRAEPDDRGGNDRAHADGSPADGSGGRDFRRSHVDDHPTDLQAACQRALHGLCEELRLDVGLILQRENETTRVRPLASFARTGVPETPEPGELAFLWRLARASDLGDPIHPELASGLARRTGFTSARALSAPSAIRALAPGGLLVLVGGEHDPVGRVRPRTLARLDAVAARLQSPLEQARTFSRIAELDDAVKRLDRLALLGSLVAEVIHEVRNPMVSIKTFLELLPERLDDPEFHDEFRGLVLQEVFRLERLLDHVLAHARPGPTHERPEDAHVGDALSGLEQLLAHRAREAGVSLTAVALEDDLGAAALSPDALRQVLLNLCVNAIEACGEGGAVRVTARRRSHARSAASLEIWVEDDGPGISEADRELVFEPFHTRRSDAPGGLGLAISRRLAEEAGGRLFVAQAADGGARFVLRLPAAGKTAPAAGKTAPAAD